MHRGALRPLPLDETTYVDVSHFPLGPIPVYHDGDGAREGNVCLAAVTDPVVDQ
jgi:hypothetical protein